MKLESPTGIRRCHFEGENMKQFCALCSGLALLLAASSSCHADDIKQRVAQPWKQGTPYHPGDLVNFQGGAYKALAGATHRHPDPNTDEGWRKLNDCDDKAANAVHCVSEELQTKISSEELTKENYSAVQDNMMRPSLPPSR
jgi:hypothetical protein